MKNKYLLFTLVLVIGFGIGWVFKPSGSEKVNDTEHNHTEESKNQIWTCSMHPQIQKSEPGDCPICGMELIPMQNDRDGGADPNAIAMSATAMQLAQVQTMKVGRSKAIKTVQLEGKIQADERLVYNQTSHIPGRIEKLFVNFEGEFVKKGQIIANVYSPDLVTAQRELMEAIKIKDIQPQLLRAAKAKLKNWKLTDHQIEKMVSSKKIINEFPIVANNSGYVTEKMVNLGDHVMEGQPLYEVADLSRVWVMLDVHESDLMWIEEGMPVTYSVAAIPGKTFAGVVSFMDPTINPKTRVAQARLVKANPNYRLKPEMFVSAKVDAAIPSDSASISVPKSAVMWTGKRSVVYVMQNTSDAIRFNMREVILGPQLGDGYLIQSGLEAGEEVVVNGTFSIDAAAQLSGKPSMMASQGGAAITGHNHTNTHSGKNEDSYAASANEAATAQTSPLLWEEVLQPYFRLKVALANDDEGKALVAWKKLSKNTKTWREEPFAERPPYSTLLQTLEQGVGEPLNLASLREKFFHISQPLIALAQRAKDLPDTLYVQHCPMAQKNNGADWLSREKEILNPYFGASMLKCGATTATLQP